MSGPVVQLAEICNINLNGVAPLSRYDYRDGDVPVIGNGRKPRGYHDDSNVPELSILISRTGCYGHVSRYEEPVFVTNEAYILTDVSPQVDQNYLYAYLKYIVASKLQRRTAKDTKGLSFDRLSRLKIVVPDLALQQKVSKAYLEFERHGESSAFDKRTLKAIEDIQAAISLHSKSSTNQQLRWFAFIKRFLMDTMILMFIAVILFCIYPESRLSRFMMEDAGVAKTLQRAKTMLIETCLSSDMFDNKTCRAITYSMN